jgi:hypothetical protein
MMMTMKKKIPLHQFFSSPFLPSFLASIIINSKEKNNVNHSATDFSLSG